MNEPSDRGKIIGLFSRDLMFTAGLGVLFAFSSFVPLFFTTFFLLWFLFDTLGIELFSDLEAGMIWPCIWIPAMFSGALVAILFHILGDRLKMNNLRSGAGCFGGVIGAFLVSLALTIYVLLFTKYD